MPDGSNTPPVVLNGPAGPGDQPSPWLRDGETISYDGGVTVPQDVPGGSKGPGTINTAGMYVNGEPLAAAVVVSDTPPATPSPNQLWWSSLLGVLYISYNDGNSTQWVPATPSTAGGVTALQAGVVQPEWFGAIGDGIADDQPALTAAADYLISLRGGTMLMGVKPYRIASKWVIKAPDPVDPNAPLPPCMVNLQGAGGTSVTGQGTKIMCDVPDTDGVVFENLDHAGIEKLSIEGMGGTTRLKSGYLVKFIHGCGYVTMRDVVVQRGFNLIGLSHGLQFMPQNVRTRQAGGKYAWHSAPLDGDVRSMDAVQGIDCSFGAADIRKRYDNDGVSLIYNYAIYVANVTDVRITQIRKDNYSKTRLVQGVDYTITQNASDGVRVVYPDGSPPPVSVWTDVTREQPDYEVEGVKYPVIFMFEGRTGSHKFVNSTGGFGGDGFVFRRSTVPGQVVQNSSAIMFANWGLENTSGDVLRIHHGSDYRLVNCYLNGDGYGLNVVYDPAIAPNIAGVTQTPGLDTVRIQTAQPHNLTNDSVTYPGYARNTAGVTGVLSNPPIYLVNGRWFVKVVDATHFDLAGLAFVNPEGDLEPGAPSIWKELPDSPEPVYTAGTGSWQVDVPGRGNVRVSNSNMRSNLLSNARADMPGVTITDSQMTPAGRGNKDFYGDNVIAVTGSVGGTSGLLRVTTKYPAEIRTGEVVRLTHLKKGGVTQFSVPRWLVTKINSTTFDLQGSTYTGPYDPMNDDNPVFLLRVGSSFEICEHAQGFNASGNHSGDWVEGDEDAQDYAVINKCASALTFKDNFVGGVRVQPIRNFAPDNRQRWLDNYDYKNYGATVISRYDNGIVSTMQMQGTGSPEGVVEAGVGSTYMDISVGLSWKKRSGIAKIGWVPDLLEAPFVPLFTFLAPTDLSVVYTTQFGFYVRWGGLIWYRIQLNFTPTFTTGAEIRIDGLPVPALETGDGGLVTETNTNMTWPTGAIDGRLVTSTGQTYLRMHALKTNSIPVAFTAANLVSGQITSLAFNGQYRVA